MKLSKKGLEFLKLEEGLAPVKYQVTIDGVTHYKPYKCTGGKWTTGYGCTFYPSGKVVTDKDPAITKEEAELLLLNVLDHFEDGINTVIISNLSQNQYDALVSFVFNIGLPQFKTSTILKRINADKKDERIKYEFSRWNKEQCGTDKEGRPLYRENKVLTARRKRESDLYFS